MTIKPKILVVEDEARIANFTCAVLSANGYETIRAATASEAVLMISSHCPDLVILDLGLPDGDGLDIIRAVREWTRLPIVVVSARTHERDKVEALDVGADDYITKPFGTDELIRMCLIFYCRFWMMVILQILKAEKSALRIPPIPAAARSDKGHQMV